MILSLDTRSPLQAGRLFKIAIYQMKCSDRKPFKRALTACWGKIHAAFFFWQKSYFCMELGSIRSQLHGAGPWIFYFQLQGGIFPKKSEDFLFQNPPWPLTPCGLGNLCGSHLGMWRLLGWHFDSGRLTCAKVWMCQCQNTNKEVPIRRWRP